MPTDPALIPQHVVDAYNRADPQNAETRIAAALDALFTAEPIEYREKDQFRGMVVPRNLLAAVLEAHRAD